MYGDDVNKGFPVGYYLDNLSVDFSGGLDPNQEDTIYVQIADYMSSALEEANVFSTQFGSGNFVVTFDDLPALDEDVRETVTATVTESRTGNVERIFHITETEAASSYFVATSPDIWLDYDPSAPETLTLHYASDEVNAVFEYEMTLDEGVYVDDLEEPSVYLSILYDSGDNPEEADALTVTLSADGTGRKIALQETGDDAHSYSFDSGTERVEINHQTPNTALFQIVAYIPAETENSVVATVAPDSGPLTQIDLALVSSGEYRSGPIAVQDERVNCADVADLVEFSAITCLEVATASDSDTDGDTVEISIDSQGTSSLSRFKKGGLLVFGDGRINILGINLGW